MEYIHPIKPWIVLIFLLLCLPSCKSASEFQIKDLAKSDIAQVSEIHMEEAVSICRELTRKLYLRNPGELAKSKGQTIESRMDQIFRCPVIPENTDMEGKQGTEAMLTGLAPDYTGDRVFAVMFGLYTMIRQAYNDRCELFMLDYLDQQRLYNAARNVEILVWRLKTRKDEHGTLLLLTNSRGNEAQNLSYERLFGKLIATQDLMAQIVSQRSGRLIREVVLTAGMAFIPMGALAGPAI